MATGSAARIDVNSMVLAVVTSRGGELDEPFLEDHWSFYIHIHGVYVLDRQYDDACYLSDYSKHR